VVGGIAGAYALYAVFEGSPIYSKHRQGLGTDGYGAQSMIHLGQRGAFAAEVILTFIFVSVVLFATARGAFNHFAGVAIGLGLALVHLVGIPLTGTSVNPARSIGPALVVGGVALSQLWLFIVAPLIGGVVAGAVHILLRPKDEDEPALDEAGAT
jgi:aquaporin Z